MTKNGNVALLRARRRLIRGLLLALAKGHMEVLETILITTVEIVHVYNYQSTVLLQNSKECKLVYMRISAYKPNDLDEEKRHKKRSIKFKIRKLIAIHYFQIIDTNNSYCRLKCIPSLFKT